ncbi:hypothetical protein BDZ85DRAFT_18874 [Elsinoe ampelina]|uniref:Uncharacterized protein n=1 Tax=Elsinoe ampelina TaxID=302913 RepID=A0A6A6G746_9PEZI|nr:hypothetical protein BDZ85DRAFT_18874 [Elsinoe ampelina]
MAAASSSTSSTNAPPTQATSTTSAAPAQARKLRRYTNYDSMLLENASTTPLPAQKLFTCPGGDQPLGSYEVAKARVMISLQQTTRWGFKDSGTNNGKGEACGLLVLRIYFRHPPGFKLRSARGDLLFPCTTRLGLVHPQELRGSPREISVTSNREVMPSISATNFFDVGGVGASRAMEGTEVDCWVFTANKEEASTIQKECNLGWNLVDRKTTASGVFGRSLHLFSELVFDGVEPKEFDVEIRVDGQLRSNTRRLFRLSHRPCVKQRKIVTNFPMTPIVVDDYAESLVQQVMEDNLTLPYMFDDRLPLRQS